MNRNVIERRFASLKQWRGIVTRYDKLAIIYRVPGVLNAVIPWVRTLSYTPWADYGPLDRGSGLAGCSTTAHRPRRLIRLPGSQYVFTNLSRTRLEESTL
jgi:hypothetical protein